MRFCALLLFGVVALAGESRASETPGPHRENNPHMGSFTQPVLWERDNIRIEAPVGFPVCSVLDSFSSVASFYIPIDPLTPCEQFDASGGEWTDYVIIDPYLDVPMNTPTLDDYIRKRESFFCAGKNLSPEGDKVRAPSDAPTKRTGVGKRLMGLETVTCTRTDKKSDRYSKAFVAYKPDPINLDGRGYTVAAYVHIKNKKAADRLLDQVVKLLKPLDPKR